jgi:low affinity Fe/Cu permease
MPNQRTNGFASLSRKVSEAVGTPHAFILAVAIILVWALTGPIFGFSDTWQLVVNTGTTILTFLMVFVIQNTQNRDTRALQVKLDELIYTSKVANNEMLDLEEMDEEELRKMQDKFEALAAKARERRGGRT